MGFILSPQGGQQRPGSIVISYTKSYIQNIPNLSLVGLLAMCCCNKMDVEAVF